MQKVSTIEGMSIVTIQYTVEIAMPDIR
jgi:hypothetical protein